MNKLSSQDRSTLIRLASELPKGDVIRKAILTGLRSRNDYLDSLHKSEAKESLFTFRNKALEDLWNDVFTGQISDGMWENTPGTGWIYWANVPTTIGSKTYLKGKVPYGVKQTFAFNRLIEYVGQDMLETIQKTEPTATMDTVAAYTKEIMLALRSAAKGEEVPEVVEKTLAPVLPDSYNNDDVLQARNLALKVIQNEYGAGKIVKEAFMLNRTGLRNNKYHYFVVLNYPTEAKAVSAYGALGKTPKPVLLKELTAIPNATATVMEKAKAKKSSGYVQVNIPNQFPSTMLSL